MKQWLTTSGQGRRSFYGLHKEILSCSSAFQIEQLVLKESSHFDAVHCSTAMQKLGKLVSRNPQAYQTILHHSKHLVFSPRELSSLLYSLARYQTANGSSMPDFLLEKVFSSHLSQFKPQDIALSLWALAKMEDPALQSDRCRFHLQNMLHSLIQRGISDFNSQDVSNSMWAIAKMRHVFDDIHVMQWCALVAQELKTSRLLKTMQVQEVVNILWALSTLQYYKQDTALWELLLNALIHHPHHVTPQGIANVVWSLANVHCVHQACLQHVVNQLHAAQLSIFNSQDVASILWGLSVLEYKSLKVLRRFHQEIAARKSFSTFSFQAMITTLMAFAKFRIQVSDLLEMAQERLTGNEFQSMSNQDVTNLLWSFAQLNPPVRTESQNEFFSRVSQELTSRMWSPHAGINILWSLACLDVLHLPHVRDWIQTRKFEGDSELERQQLFQSKLAWNQVYKNKLNVDAHIVSSSLHDVVAVGGTRSSQIHKEISTALKALHSDVENESVLLGGLVVDVFIPSLQVVIEVDGPSHFLDDGITYTGSTLFKQRLLTRGGFKLRCISLKEYESLSMNEAHRFLSQLLQGCIQ